MGKIKARDIIPHWPKGRSTLPALDLWPAPWRSPNDDDYQKQQAIQAEHYRLIYGYGRFYDETMPWNRRDGV